MKVAVLLDLDNIKNENSLSRIFVELPAFGEIVYKYGFYSNFNDKHIKRILHQYGIVPIMVPSFSNSKSCADIALTIKAMDLLSNPQIDCFAIISNDSDFILLSSRIREDNRKTIIVTDKETIDRNKYRFFDNAIDIYNLLNTSAIGENNLVSKQELTVIEGERDEMTDKVEEIIANTENIELDKVKYIDYSNENDDIIDLLNRIKIACQNIAIENDFVRLSMLVEYLNKNGNKFNPKEYGHSNRRAKDFFEKKLGKYFEIKISKSTAFIKFKEDESNGTSK